MALIRCSVGLSEEIIAVFHMKKSQVDIENDKNPKISQFSKSLCIFSRIFDGLCGLEQGKRSKRKECVVRRVYYIFVNENVSNLHRK